MSSKLPLCLKMLSLPPNYGVDWMKRRTKVHFKAIHVSIPVRLLEDFDETLGFTQSRSKKICALITRELRGSTQEISEASTRQLMAALTNRNDVDDTMKTLLLQILAK